MKYLRLLAATLLLLSAGLAHALTLVPYSAEALSNAQKVDAPFAVHFHASWCPTCRAQNNAFHALKDDPSLNMTIFVADYDTERALKKQLEVRAQSTLVVFRGAQERARSTGDTKPDALKALLKQAE